MSKDHASHRASYGQTSSNIWGPVILTRTEHCRDGIETSAHTLPKPLLREFQHVFPEVTFPENIKSCQTFAIPTNQKARLDLVAIGDHVEEEKDRLLNAFMSFARAVCQKFTEAGYWADFIDPCSGLPMLTHANKVYSEVDGMECCLGYKAHNAGFCKILTHPAWGSAVYPATIFCHAPAPVVVQVLESFPCLAEDFR